MDIYRAAKRRGKSSLTFTDTELNNRFSIYHTILIISEPKRFLCATSDRKLRNLSRRLLGGE